MTTILVNGFSCVGKSTLARRLIETGETAISCDGDSKLARWVNRANGEVVERPDHPDQQWMVRHSWSWSEARLEALIQRHARAARLWLCGNADNGEMLRDHFDVVVLLVLALPATLERVDLQWG